MVVWEQEGFRCVQTPAGSTLLVCLEGELDLASAPALGRLLRDLPACAGGAGTIRLDISNLTFCDAHSAGLIHLAGLRARARGQVLCVQGLAGLPARVFAILGIADAVRCPARDALTGGDDRGGEPTAGDGAGAGGADPSC